MRAAALAVLIALASVTPVCAAAQRPTEMVGVEQPRPVALAFTRVVLSEAIVLNSLNDDADALPLMEEAMRNEMAAVEGQRPGITRAMAVAVLPIANRSARERLPELWRRVALLYGREFDDAELETLTRLYASPLGQRLIAAAMAAAKPDAVDESVSRGKMPSIGEVMRDAAAIESAMKAALTPADRASYTAFEITDTGKRLEKLDRRVAKLLLNWHGEQTPWEAIETERAVGRVLAEYVSGTGE